MEELQALLRRLEAAVQARKHLRSRPLGATIAALATAAAGWRESTELHALVSDATGLSSAAVAAALAAAAEAIEPEAMTALAEREWGAGAVHRPIPAGPALVAHVVASNVPALALPAIALGCVAGAAVVVKSGRHDRHSAAAFQRALEAVDPELAATVVATYWPGGDPAREDAVLRGADVVVGTGSGGTLTALERRLGARLIAHGPRVSVAVVGNGGSTDGTALALAADVALHDQRGCLSPHAVYVAGDARAFAERLTAALDVLATDLPPGEAALEERAAVRHTAAEAEWARETVLSSARSGTVIYGESPLFRVGPGLRTVRVHPLPSLKALPGLLPPDAIECVGVAHADGRALAGELRARGVSRVCAAGRMQRPRLSWPRGQYPPLGVLLGRRGDPEIEVEP